MFDNHPRALFLNAKEDITKVEHGSNFLALCLDEKMSRVELPLFFISSYFPSHLSV